MSVLVKLKQLTRGVARSIMRLRCTYGRRVLAWLGHAGFWRIPHPLQSFLPLYLQFAMDYPPWVGRHDSLNESDCRLISTEIRCMTVTPLISVIMPVSNPRAELLDRAIQSVQRQLYPHWELCIAAGTSPDPAIRRVLEQHTESAPRIRVVGRPADNPIAADRNSALELARGEYVTVLDQHDVLPRHALYMVARELAQHPDSDIIYTDEDRIDETGRRHDPYFKADWDPVLILSQNFVSRLGVYRRTLVRQVGGFRPEVESGQDHDLVLLLSEHTCADGIRHIPNVLYHRHMADSTAEAPCNADGVFYRVPCTPGGSAQGEYHHPDARPTGAPAQLRTNGDRQDGIPGSRAYHCGQ